MEDKRKINHPGIDTQWEKDTINYKPQLEYNLPSIQTPEGSISTSNTTPELKSRIKPKASLLWNQAINILETADKIIDRLEESLKDVSADIPPHLIEEAGELAKKLGFNIEDKKIPFDLYKRTFTLQSSREKDLIQDIYDNYHADVNGDLKAELYSDVLNIKEDWLDMVDFINKGYFSQFVPEGKLPKEIVRDDPAIEEIDKEEEMIAERYLSSRAEHHRNSKNVSKLYAQNSESEDFYQAEKRYTQVKKTMNQLERRIQTKIDVASAIESKASQALSLLSTIDSLIDYRAYEGHLYDILHTLLRQYSSGQSIQNGLRRIQALIKLSVDGKIEKLNVTKSNARSITDRRNKKRVNQALINGVHLRNIIYGDVYDIMNHFDNPLDNPVFNTLAGHIVDSVVHADDTYQKQSTNFYRMHTMDAELKREKIKGLVDKDTAREIYKIISKLIVFGSQKGWPNPSSLSQWLEDFIEHEKIE